MTLLPGWRRYCYQIETARCSPEAVNVLWALHTEGRWLGVFALRENAQGAAGDEATDWWRQWGGGVTDLADDEHEARATLDAFLREYRLCFRRLWIGSATEWPPACNERPLLLFDG